MILAKALRHVVVYGLLAVSLCTSVHAAMPASAIAVATDRTGPPGGEQALSGVGTKEEVELGRKIYVEGIGAHDKPITGVRFGGVELQGAMVACVSCHRRSGPLQRQDKQEKEGYELAHVGEANTARACRTTSMSASISSRASP